MTQCSLATVAFVQSVPVVVSLERGNGRAWGSIAAAWGSPLALRAGDVVTLAMARGGDMRVRIIGEERDAGGYAFRER